MFQRIDQYRFLPMFLQYRKTHTFLYEDPQNNQGCLDIEQHIYLLNYHWICHLNIRKHISQGQHFQLNMHNSMGYLGSQ